MVLAAESDINIYSSDAFDIPSVRGVTARQGITRNGHKLVRSMSLVDTSGASNFLFTKEGGDGVTEVHTITQFFIREANKYAQEDGIKLRLVTIPVFPPAFYEEFRDVSWSPHLGDYDLRKNT